MNSGDCVHTIRDSALKSYSESRERRMGFQSKKCLDMNEGVSYKKILICANDAFVVGLGRVTKLNVGGLIKLTDLKIA